MKGKKRWISAAGIISATLLIGAVWILLPAPEPVYQGKPLSYWLAELGGPRHQIPSKVDATSAIQHIGTNAIPTLLRFLLARDFFVAEKLNTVLDHLPWVHFRFQTDRIKYNMAVTGFKMLGPLGRGALPELIRIYERQPHSVSPRTEVAEIFGRIGAEAASAVPLLVLAVATDSFAEQRSAAARALGEIAERPEICIPALLAALKDASELVRTDAAISLGKFDSQPDNIVPALIAALQDPALGVKYFAALALGHLHSQPENSIPILIIGLGDSNNIVVRRASAVALSEFGPAARAALPILRLAVLQMHNAPDSAGSVYLGPAKQAIAKISPSNSELCDFQY